MDYNMYAVIETLGDQIRTKNNIIEHNRSELEKKEEVIKELMEEISDLGEKISSKTEIIKNLNEKGFNSGEEIRKLKKDIDIQKSTLKKSFDSWNNDFQVAQKEIDTLKEQKENLVKYIEDLRSCVKLILDTEERSVYYVDDVEIVNKDFKVSDYKKLESIFNKFKEEA